MGEADSAPAYPAAVTNRRPPERFVAAAGSQPDFGAHLSGWDRFVTEKGLRSLLPNRNRPERPKLCPGRDLGKQGVSAARNALIDHAAGDLVVRGGHKFFPAVNLYVDG